MIHKRLKGRKINYSAMENTTLSEVRMLSVPAVSKILGKKDETIRRLAKAGSIPGAKRVGGQWRFLPAELAKYIGAEGEL